MSDAFFVTNGDARRQVENGWHDDSILRMWQAGSDTLTIARTLTVHESVAARRLRQVRSSVVSRVSEKTEIAGRVSG